MKRKMKLYVDLFTLNVPSFSPFKFYRTSWNLEILVTNYHYSISFKALSNLLLIILLQVEQMAG